MQELDLHVLLKNWPQRSYDCHKGLLGHVLVIAGSTGYGGAARLAAEGAIRVGAGLTSLVTHPYHAAMMIVARPEIMSHGVTELQSLLPLLHRSTVIAMGPGLVHEPWAEGLLAGVFQQYGKVSEEKWRVVDAGALDYVHRHHLHSEKWVLTPHAGEAARLLDTTVEQISANRLEAAQLLQVRYGGYVILKGARTLVATPDQEIYSCPYGNPGMASGGMGDLLSGVLAGLLAQTPLQVKNAILLGVALHSYAADLAAQETGQRGLLALDLIPYIRQLLYVNC